MKIGSLFSGIGGFDKAFESAGFTVAWQSEIDSHAQAVLRRHWPGVTLYDDVTTMNGADVEPVDIVTFGSPCQDLSVAGKRGGLEGERSGLFHEAVRLMHEMREATNGRYPTLAVWENVPGAYSSNNGRDFGAVLDRLAGIGALDIGYRICDAQYWGVPQRRRRIFLVADFGGHRAGEILALGTGRSRNLAASTAAREDTAARVVSGVGAVGLDSISGTLGTRHRPDEIDSHGAYVVADIRNGAIDHDVTMTLQAKESGSISVNTIPHLVANTLPASGTYDRGDGSGNLVVAASGNRVVNAITANLAKGTGGPSGDEGNHLIVAPVDFVNVTSKTNRTRREFGSPANTLHQGGQSVAFAQNQAGDVYTSEVVGAIATNSNASGRSTAKISSPTGIRRLTPAECEALQGFPRNWTDGHADTHRYRMLGNSVAVPVVEWLARAVRAALS